MDEASALVAIYNLRTNPAYQQAERLRRNTAGGAAAMATAPENSEEFAAVHLLISTWETIATLLASVEHKDRIFEVTPICHMHNHLKDAIPALGLKHVNLRAADEFHIPNAGYGANFSMLASEYHSWTIEKNKSAHYITGSCDGMYACFG